MSSNHSNRTSLTQEGDESELDDNVALLHEPEDLSVIRVGLIADKEVTLGLLLAGIGYHREKFRNYLMVEPDTPMSEIEEFFQVLYKQSNIGIILLDYPTAKKMNHVLDKCKKLLPVVVILPTKASIIPYMEEKDRIRRQRLRDAYI